MRKILFKAKRKDNGEWVYWNIYGMICNKNGKVRRLSVKRNLSTTSYYHYIHQIINLIDENTICQYTGLTDKNDNKIWENDVVKDTDIHLLGSVEYDEEHGTVLSAVYGRRYGAERYYRDLYRSAGL